MVIGLVLHTAVFVVASYCWMFPRSCVAVRLPPTSTQFAVSDHRSVETGLQNIWLAEAPAWTVRDNAGLAKIPESVTVFRVGSVPAAFGLAQASQVTCGLSSASPSPWLRCRHCWEQ